MLKKPKITATVRGLEEAVAREMGMSRAAVIADLVGAADMAKLMMDPGQIINALKNIAQMSGYYRQEDLKGERLTIGRGTAQAKYSAMSDAQLLALIAQGAGAA